MDKTNINTTPNSFNDWDGEKQLGLEIIPSDESRRICGLRAGIFWLVVVLIVVIVAGGIGGSVGGAIALHQSSKSGAGHTRYALFKYQASREQNSDPLNE